MPGYHNDVFWKELQAYLPAGNRLTADEMPVETYQRIGRQNVHLDIYPQEAPKARVLLLHGVGGNGRLLSCFALPLWRQGYEVICPDLPLYGCTETSGDITYPLWVDCAAALAQSLSGDAVPLFLFGLSAGGMLAYQAACRCPFVRGVLLTCLLDLRERPIREAITIHPWVGRFSTGLSGFAHRYFGSLHLPLKWLVKMKQIANNPQVATLLMRDPRSSGACIPFSFLDTMLNPAIEIEPEDYAAGPVCLLHPAEDRWTDVALSRLFYDRLTCEKEMHLLEGAGHFPFESSGLQQCASLCLCFLQRHI